MAGATDKERSAWRLEAAAILILALAVCAFWWRLVLMRGFLALEDMGALFMPLFKLYGLALADGRLPLWTPELGAGYPLLAEGEIGPLYPPNLILQRLFSPLVAMNLIVVGHALLATLGAYACARALGISRTGAMLSGLAFGLSGFMVVRVPHIHIVLTAAWLPLLILCVDRAAASPRPWRRSLGIGAVTGMQYLVGHPQVMALCLVAAAWYAAFAAAAEGRGRFWPRAGRFWPPVAAGILLGLGLGAWQVVPTLSVMSYSGRPALGGGWGSYGVMPPYYLVSLLLPTLLGSAKANTFPAWLWPFQEWCGYVGAIALLLAVALLRRGAGWRVWALVSLTTAGLAVAVSPHLAGALGRVPLLQGARFTTRTLLFFVFSASLLAGMGLDWARMSGRPAVRLLAWSAAVLFCFGLFLRVWPHPWLWIVSNPHTVRARDLTHYAREPELWLIAATLAAAALALRLLRRRPRWAGGAVALLAGVELFAFSANYQPLVSSAFYASAPWTAQAIAARTTGRVFSLPYAGEPRWDRFLGQRGDWSRDRRMLDAHREALSDNWPAWWGLRGLRVYLGLPLRPYERMSRLLTFEVPPHEARATGALGVGAVVYSPFLGAEPHPTEIGWVPYAPRARVVGALRARNGDEAVALLSQRSDPRRQTVIVAPDTIFLPAHADGRARIAQDTPMRVVVEVASRGPGVLALADALAPGWHAAVNGREAPIWLADGMFRGVAVPPGESRVVFDYRPTAVRVGFFAGLAAAMLFCGLLAGYLVLRRANCGSRSAWARR